MSKKINRLRDEIEEHMAALRMRHQPDQSSDDRLWVDGILYGYQRVLNMINEKKEN